MTHSSKSRYEVFEFAEEDEMVGKLDVKLQSRLQNPKFDDSPSLKYNFLSCVAQGSDINERRSVAVQCVDVDPVDEVSPCSSNAAMQTLSILMEDGSSRPLLGCNGAINLALEPSCHMSENTYVDRNSNSDIDNKVSSPEGHIPEDGHIGSPFTQSPTNSGSINSAKSTPVLSNKHRSLSPPDGFADVCADPHTFKGLDMEEVDCVIIQADYIVFRGDYYPASRMTFSEHSIKFENSFMGKDVENVMYEWTINDDVVRIQSQDYTRDSMVKVRIHVLAKSTVKTESMHNASGIEELEVMLIDPEWFLSMEKIMSLNLRYKAAWKVLAPLDMVDDGNDLLVNKMQLLRRPYFPHFDEPFDEVIYPEGDPDAVCISKRDVDLLNPETFINDTIIDFYIMYLKREIPAAERNRFHFFNSFFFRKLADLDKNPDSVFDGKAAFQRVRKWTRKVKNFFEKDYIFIPVNYNLHWSLIVISHPGQVANSTDEEMNESSKVPCILHMDSIRGSHAGLKKLIQSYLLEEWKERQNVTSEDICSKFSNLRFLSLELPQQANYYDCGLFLLHYVELFVKDAPANFNPFNIAKHSNFLTMDWFIPADVSLKRPYIQRLIREILLNRSQGHSNNSITAEDNVQEPILEEDSGNGNSTQHITVSCDLQNMCTTDSLYSGTFQGIDMNLRGRSPVRSSNCPSQPSLGFRDLFEPGPSGLFSDQRFTMSPIQEEADEDDADHMYSMQNGSNLSFGTASCYRSFDPLDEDEEEEEEEEDQEVEDSPPDSPYESDDDSDVEVIETSLERRDVTLSPQNEKEDPPKCSALENVENLTDSFVSASSEMMVTPAEGFQQYLDGLENEHQMPSQKHEDQAFAEEDGLIIKNSDSDSDELQPAKRLKLAPLDGETVETETDPLENISSER